MIPSGAKALTHAALAAWVVSLALPAIYVNDNHEAWYGAFVLAWGLAMGWIANGWAVYANLFFAWILFSLYRGKRPAISVAIMWLLVATLPLFTQAATGGNAPRLESWGWGFVAWLAAFTLATIAAAVRAGLAGVGYRVALSGFVVAVGAAVGFHALQKSQANVQERLAYFPPGAAFAVHDLCGIALSWPEGAVVPPGSVVQLDVDPTLRNFKDGVYLHLPTLPDYQEDGYRWVSYPTSRTNPLGVRIREPVAAPAQVVLEARPAQDGAVIRVKDAQAGKVLYEQPLRRRGYAYCPEGETGHIDRRWTTDAAVMRALGVETAPGPVPEPSTLVPEAMMQRCDVGAEIDRMRNLREWDGRAVAFSPALDPRARGYCSPRYAALLDVWPRWPQAGQVTVSVRLFDRATLRPIATFSGKPTCRDEDACKSTPDEPRGLRVEEGGAVVEMPAGDLRVRRQPAY